jgi:hypothetical protein
MDLKEVPYIGAVIVPLGVDVASLLEDLQWLSDFTASLKPDVDVALMDGDEIAVRALGSQPRAPLQQGQRTFSNDRLTDEGLALMLNWSAQRSVAAFVAQSTSQDGTPLLPVVVTSSWMSHGEKAIRAVVRPSIMEVMKPFMNGVSTIPSRLFGSLTPEDVSASFERLKPSLGNGHMFGSFAEAVKDVVRRYAKQLAAAGAPSKPGNGQGREHDGPHHEERPQAPTPSDSGGGQ